MKHTPSCDRPGLSPGCSSLINFFMVQIQDYHVRNCQEGKTFISLELAGDIELVQSSKTGNFYATCRRCSITSTFDEETAKRMVGKQLPGSIAKVESEPYEYTVKETGEVVMLSHKYQYIPETGAPATTVPSRAVVV